eukprot:1209421-Karenia_brevis.AAC.1
MAAGSGSTQVDVGDGGGGAGSGTSGCGAASSSDFGSSVMLNSGTFLCSSVASSDPTLLVS